VHAGQEVMMEVGGNISLIVCIPQGILDPQLSPHPGPIIKYYHYLNEGKSAAILTPGGSMVLSYVLQLLFNENSQNC
jgi:hypothetical protein